MYDQASLVADVVKFHYEMRFPEQGADLADRAVALASGAPEGPACLGLPREVLMAGVPEALRRPASARAAAAPAHPCVVGHDVKAALAGADLVLVLDAAIPWIASGMAPEPGAKVVHMGPGPHFARMPVRGFRTDLAIAADPLAGIRALLAAMPAPDDRAKARRAALAERSAARRDRAAALARAGRGSPASAEWLSRCLSDVMDDRAVIFSELGVQPGVMELTGPNRVFGAPHSRGLGRGMPAALGAQLADRERLVIACVGDGSHVFANPVACHQIAEAPALPILTVIKNNGMWNAVRRSVMGSYPTGAAAKANAMPLTSLQPQPDFLAVAGASRAWTARVTDGADLPGVLAEAVRVIREERRQALVDVTVALSDAH